jgi:hypothetical protein
MAGERLGEQSGARQRPHGEAAFSVETDREMGAPAMEKMVTDAVPPNVMLSGALQRVRSN